MNAAEILKRPYARILIPEPDGRFTAEIMEFPGCVSVGDNEADALRNLEAVAVDWIDATIEQGQDVPEPMDSADFSGRLVLRMARGLHKRATMCAEREGVSLNQFITTCLAEAVGERARSLFITVSPNQPQLHIIGLASPGANLTGTQVLRYGATFQQITRGSTRSNAPCPEELQRA